MQQKIRFILLLSAFSFLACSDLIELTPQNSITYRNALETQKDLESVLHGAAQLAMSISIINNGYESALKGEYADIYNPSYRILREFEPEAQLAGRFEDHYLLIAQSNVVLEFSPTIAMSQERRQMYNGQANFYKALAYFDLLKKFGDCVLIKDEVELYPKAKSPRTEVADYAIELAALAAEQLPEFEQVTNHLGAAPRYKSTPSKGAANALLAHLCAWKAGTKYFAEDPDYDEMALWSQAEAACTQIIKSGSYQLATSPEEVCTEVLVGDSKESIYEIVFKDMWHENPNFIVYPIFIAIGYQTYPVKPNSSPFDVRNAPFRIENATVREMYPNNDERKFAYFYRFEEMSRPENALISGGFAYPYKWRNILVNTEGWSAGLFRDNFNMNKIWWRLADIILLRAECRARLGNTEGAIQDINTIRARAKADLYDANEYGGDVRYAVFKEREKELLLEETRYWDIIRNGYVREELEGRVRVASDQDFIDGMFFLPIGSAAFQRNPLMRQNKYWQKYL
jgi:hypothetical protein